MPLTQHKTHFQFILCHSLSRSPLMVLYLPVGLLVAFKPQLEHLGSVMRCRPAKRYMRMMNIRSGMIRADHMPEVSRP